MSTAASSTSSKLVKKAIDEGDPYMLAFVDMRMPPGWDGLETIQHIWEIDSEIQVVICTAFSDHSWDSIVSVLGHADRLLILKKPFDVMEVTQLAWALTWFRRGPGVSRRPVRSF